ncbi:hypothetical protein PoB_002013100 [Plakobranchus ocellatus]|uniref:Uncharacterized protein n=1 Tax=Plakobranchus ocellatus TaxID=259542 RepID=A0AAV3ZG65_9GAST|nr:hypothetical protein PoB_002013100 [Plakobranchus ocellatus]
MIETSYEHTRHILSINMTSYRYASFTLTDLTMKHVKTACFIRIYASHPLRCYNPTHGIRPGVQRRAQLTLEDGWLLHWEQVTSGRPCSSRQTSLVRVLTNSSGMASW